MKDVSIKITRHLLKEKHNLCKVIIALQYKKEIFMLSEWLKIFLTQIHFVEIVLLKAIFFGQKYEKKPFFKNFKFFLKKVLTNQFEYVNIYKSSGTGA